MENTDAEDQPPKSAEEVLPRYTEGRRDFAGMELEGVANFRGADLKGSNFADSGRLEADFREADLQGASFRGASIKLADFRGADLRGATFFPASLEAARFEGSKPNGAEFLGAYCSSNPIKEGDSFPD